MKIKSLIIFAFGLVISGGNVNANPDLPVEGKTIFTSRCTACHSVNKTLTGPALAGVDKRRSTEWIINFVHSSQSMVKKGDKDAVALYEKFSKIAMPDHPDLTDENIKSIVEFIKSESRSAVNENTALAKPMERKPNYVPLSIEKDWGFFLSFLGSVIMLIAALLFAVHVKALQADYK